jgi:hypothetical protein
MSLTEAKAAEVRSVVYNLVSLDFAQFERQRARRDESIALCVEPKLGQYAIGIASGRADGCTQLHWRKAKTRCRAHLEADPRFREINLLRQTVRSRPRIVHRFIELLS